MMLGSLLGARAAAPRRRRASRPSRADELREPGDVAGGGVGADMGICFLRPAVFLGLLTFCLCLSSAALTEDSREIGRASCRERV